MFVLRHLPNALSLARVPFVFLGLWFYYEGRLDLFLLLVFFSLASDFLDGFLARQFSVSSELGAILDPACDKVATVILVAFFYLEGVLSKFFCAALMMRSLVQILTFLFVKYHRVKFSVKPNFFSKLLTFSVFSLLIFFAFILYLGEQIIWSQSLLLKSILMGVSLGEIYFMVHYPYQFYKILSQKKLGFD